MDWISIVVQGSIEIPSCLDTTYIYIREMLINITISGTMII